MDCLLSCVRLREGQCPSPTGGAGRPGGRPLRCFFVGVGVVIDVEDAAVGVYEALFNGGEEVVVGLGYVGGGFFRGADVDEPVPD